MSLFGGAEVFLIGATDVTWAAVLLAEEDSLEEVPPVTVCFFRFCPCDRGNWHFSGLGLWAGGRPRVLFSLAVRNERVCVCVMKA